jgi:hypothetical protein
LNKPFAFYFLNSAFSETVELALSISKTLLMIGFSKLLFSALLLANDFIIKVTSLILKALTLAFIAEINSRCPSAKASDSDTGGGDAEVILGLLGAGLARLWRLSKSLNTCAALGGGGIIPPFTSAEPMIELCETSVLVRFGLLSDVSSCGLLREGVKGLDGTGTFSKSKSLTS